MSPGYQRKPLNPSEASNESLASQSLTIRTVTAVYDRKSQNSGSGRYLNDHPYILYKNRTISRYSINRKNLSDGLASGHCSLQRIKELKQLRDAMAQAQSTKGGKMMTSHRNLHLIGASTEAPLLGTHFDFSNLLQRSKSLHFAINRLAIDRQVIFTSEKHRMRIIWLKQTRSGNVEVNPGPHSTQRNSSVMGTSYNVRGLNDEPKLRHLINYCYLKIRNGRDLDHFFLFQETFIAKANKIPYLWRGNYHLTPGSGNGSGCISLFSSHINVVHQVDFGMRGHVLVCQKSGEQRVFAIVANIYAPCPNNQEKIVFFEEVFDKISEVMVTYECNNVIVAGDFNLNFKESEMKNRNFSAQEKRAAQIVENFANGLGLVDVWKERESLFTWRRANTDVFSTIDRILFSKHSQAITGVVTNWSLSMSDHAAIELSLKTKGELNINRSKITRLDPSLLNNQEVKAKIVTEFEKLFSHGFYISFYFRFQ